MSVTKRTAQLELKSEDRINTTEDASRCTYRISPSPHGVIGVKLLNAIIPATFYNIKSTQNRFVFARSGVDYYFDLEEGNYQATELAAVIQTGMNTADPGVIGGYAVTYNQIKMKFEWSAQEPGYSLNWLGNANANSSMVYSILGFPNQINYTPTLVGVLDYVLTAPDVVDLNPLNKVYVNIPSFGGNFYSSDQSFANRNAVFGIYLSGYRGQEVAYSENMDYPQVMYFNRPMELGYLQVFLNDKDGLPVDLNGQEWQITMELLFNNVKKRIADDEDEENFD